MQQAASTLMSMISYDGASCAGQLMFVKALLELSHHNKYIQYASRDKLQAHHYLNTSYLHTIETRIPDIVVMSAGPHLHNLRNFYEDVLYPQLLYLKSQDKLKNIKYIWRTNHPGHYSCLTAKHKRIQHPVPFTPTPPINDTIFQWNNFKLLDNDAYLYSKIYGFKVMDMSFLYDRADSHPGYYNKPTPDCLHYCIPGPLDIFSVLMYHELLAEK